MEQEQHQQPTDARARNILPFAAVLAVAIIVGAWAYSARMDAVPAADGGVQAQASDPFQNAEVEIPWGDLGVRLVKDGVIDMEKLAAVYAGRGGLPPEMRALLETPDAASLTLTPENAGVALNLLWAFGLSNQNRILTEGPMSQTQYGGAENFASTGGWTLAVGNAMNHYSAHPFVELTASQQMLVERVAKTIYRPCCNNSTYFPDCNHGMAMLGLLEILAANGVSEPEVYRRALAVNALWFPDAYATIGTYLAQYGKRIDTESPKDILGASFSSGSGLQAVQAKLVPQTQQGGPGCGV